MLQELQDSKAEGIVFKKMSAAYLQGKAHQHFKLKFWKMLDCFVIEKNRDGKDAVELAVYKSGEVYRICGASLIGKEREGKINVGDVVEIKYLYATSTWQAVQPTILRKRDDKLPIECMIEQMIVNRDMVMSK
jgi:bifunctional non-homologous end joining protein LigD